jgi:hypothetical protein
LDAAKQAYAWPLNGGDDFDDNALQSSEGCMLDRLIRSDPKRPAEVLPEWPGIAHLEPSKPQQQKRQKQGKRLRDCLTAWEQWMIGDGEKTGSVKDTAGKFRRFLRTKGIGNLPVSDLTKEQLLLWQQWVRKQTGGNNWTIRTVKAYHGAVAKILTFAERKYETWGFPD